MLAPGVQPMKFCATDTPIETPTPVEPPPPIASDAAATVEEMLAVLDALSETSSLLLIRLFWP